MAFFMFSYEINIIFIPISLGIVLLKGGKDKIQAVFLLCAFAAIYFAITFYVRNHAINLYSGVEFSLSGKALLAYLKQISGTFPFSAYLGILHKKIHFSELFLKVIISWQGWLTFLFSFILFYRATSNMENFTKNSIEDEVYLICIGLLFFPGVLPALSGRYQNEVHWGAATLPVYYQIFGLSFLITTLFFLFSHKKSFRIVFIILFSLYLAFNYILNINMVKIVDPQFRYYRDAFVVAVKSGLFNQVKNGDIINIKGIPPDINANLIYQYSGKNVYVPRDIHDWYPESPGTSPNKFDLEVGILNNFPQFKLIKINENKNES